MNLLGRLLRLPIRLYRVTLSSLLPPSCRYAPSCSEYALDALERYGVWHGLRLSVWRILRCHPWGGHGYDPVPERRHHICRTAG